MFSFKAGRTDRFALALIVLTLLTGCGPQPQSTGLPPGSPAVRAPTGATSAETLSARMPTPHTPKLANPLDSAQKAYLQAYEQYVKLLRESGPQTLETLTALADYQRKYQTYQMMLRAQEGPASATR